MSDINPNTPVDAVSDSTTTIGENPLTFDELEQVTNEKAGKSSSKQAKESEANERKSDKEKTPKEPKVEAKTDPKPKKAGEKEDKEPVDKPPRRTFKAKHGEDELDLDEDSVFTVKVNGKDEPVSLKDIVNNYSGKVAWDKKFTDLDKMKQEYAKSNEGLSKDKNMIKEMFSEKDPQIRLFKMAQIAGVTGPEFRQAFLADNMKFLEEFSNMSDDQKKASDLEFENKWLRHQSETSNKEIQSKQAITALDQKVSSLLATHSLQKGEFVETYDKVRTLVEQGRLDKTTLTPESIVEITVKDKLWDKAAKKVSELALKWDEPTAVNNLRELVDNIYAQGFNDTQMIEIIDELWGSARGKKAVSDKVKEREAFTNTKKPVASNKQASSEAWSFDDLG